MTPAGKSYTLKDCSEAAERAVSLLQQSFPEGITLPRLKSYLSIETDFSKEEVKAGINELVVTSEVISKTGTGMATRFHVKNAKAKFKAVAKILGKTIALKKRKIDFIRKSRLDYYAEKKK